MNRSAIRSLPAVPGKPLEASTRASDSPLRTRPAFVAGGPQHWGLPLAFFWLMSIACNALVRATHVPVPGNALAILATLAFLALFPPAAAFLDATAFQLVRHLTFFFVPLAVGIIGAWTGLVPVAVPLAVTIVVSVAVGIAVTGIVAQRLLCGAV